LAFTRTVLILLTKILVFDKEKNVANHKASMSSMNTPISEEDDDLPILYWIPNLHPNPCRKLFIAYSSPCSTKELYITMTIILSVVKDGLQSYLDKTYSRSNIKNSMELLDNFDSHSFWKMSSTQTLDIWTLYATIPHEK
jgi:hypothetical protein